MESTGSAPRGWRDRGAAARSRASSVAGVAVLAVLGAMVCLAVTAAPVVAEQAGSEQPEGQDRPNRAGQKKQRGRSVLGAEINHEGYTSARICGGCHVDIYNSWKNSLHAFSLSDPVFDTAYMLALKDSGDRAKQLCLRCHAPLTQANGDFDLREGVTREGVSCDFCHTVTAVNIGKLDAPYSLEPGLVKRSVLRKASSPVHEVAYSKLHETSEFCGGCHNYALADGTAIMSTYEEWRNGPYAAEGVQCQTCHMVRSTGRVVSEDVQASAGQEMHLHNLIHDTSQLRSALSVEVTQARRNGNDLTVHVVVANVGSGHMVPTGIPSRELVLTVSVEGGSQTLRQERRYRKVLADKNGTILKQDHEALLHAVKVVADNRIGPRERRLERFSFAVPRSGSINVTASVSYVYSPMVLDQREINIELARSVRSAS